jgi:hypothetical protein
MKSLRFLLPMLVMSMTATLGCAQTGDLAGNNLDPLAVPLVGQYESAAPSVSAVDANKAAAHMDHAQKPAVPQSAAERSFDTMKKLAGAWEGRVTVPEMKAHDGDRIQTWMRVTSRGNVLVEEFQEAGTPLDATKYDHPVTMLYVDGEQLNLVHYCDAGNRPRMTGKMSPDGKRVEFEFAELSGSNRYGHMYHAVFTLVDATHHIEEWTYMNPGDKPIHATFDLHRVE